MSLDLPTQADQQYTEGDWKTFKSAYIEAAKIIATQHKTNSLNRFILYLKEVKQAIYDYGDIDQIACYLAHHELMDYINFRLKGLERDSLIERMEQGDPTILEEFSKVKDFESMSKTAPIITIQIREGKDRKADEPQIQIKTSIRDELELKGSGTFTSDATTTAAIKQWKEQKEKMETEKAERERATALDEERKANYKKYKQGHIETIDELEEEIADTYESTKIFGLRSNSRVKKGIQRLIDQWKEQIKSLESETKISRNYTKIGRLDAINLMLSSIKEGYLTRTKKNGTETEELEFDQNAAIQFGKLQLTIDRIGKNTNGYHDSEEFLEFASGEYKSFEEFKKELQKTR